MCAPVRNRGETGRQCEQSKAAPTPKDASMNPSVVKAASQPHGRRRCSDQRARAFRLGLLVFSVRVVRVLVRLLLEVGH